MGHTFSRILVHVIFTSKGRHRNLHREVRERLCAYLCGVARNENASLLEAKAEEDHVHLLMKVKPSHAVADLVRALKANSSRWIHETFPGLRDFAWQSGYAVFSVSESAAPDVQTYIKDQARHHQSVPFEHELRSFLEKHGVEFDPDHYLD